MPDYTLIHQLEDSSMNVLPSPRAVFYDNWIVRLASADFFTGYPRRANSVHIGGASTLPLEDKITRVESLYGTFGLRSVFKITPLADDALIAALEARGYLLDGDSTTTVQTCDLTTFKAAPTQHQIIADDHLTDPWLHAEIITGGETPERGIVLRALWSRISVPVRFARVLINGVPAAAGIAITDGAFVGLFAIVVDPALRRQGIGAALLNDLLAWGQRMGGTTAYLQVGSTNQPALALYDRFGFCDAYQYRYLQRATPGR